MIGKRKLIQETLIINSPNYPTIHTFKINEKKLGQD